MSSSCRVINEPIKFSFCVTEAQLTLDSSADRWLSRIPIKSQIVSLFLNIILIASGPLRLDTPGHLCNHKNMDTGHV